jgi:hypothetical protein
VNPLLLGWLIVELGILHKVLKMFPAFTGRIESIAFLSFVGISLSSILLHQGLTNGNFDMSMRTTLVASGIAITLGTLIGVGLISSMSFQGW